MNRLIEFVLKQKSNKLNFSLLISTFLVVVYDIFLIIFDVVQFILVSQNHSALANGFLIINVFGIIFNLANLCFIVVFVILKFRDIKSSEKKEKL